MAIFDCCHQAMWIINLFSEIGFHIMPMTICGNNQGSLFIGSNSVQEKWTKHIDICYHCICECIKNDKVSVILVPELTTLLTCSQRTLIESNLKSSVST